MWKLPQLECRNYDNRENNIKSVSLQSQEEMISLHNIRSDSTAVALITKSIQQGAPGSLSLDKGGVGYAPVSTTKYPPVPLVFLLTSSPLLISLSVSFSLSLSLNPHYGFSLAAQNKFCKH